MSSFRNASLAGAATPSIVAARADLLQRLFPDGVPLLWCPPLTHYDGEGGIDRARIAAHLRHLSPYIRGFLIPGSTGDGWELSDGERRQVLELALEQGQILKTHLLIGVLKAKAAEAVAAIREDMQWIKARLKDRNVDKALTKARVCGFTVCPPRGKDLAQEEIGRALASILELGLPTAIYQLPQMTQNEMSAKVAFKLAQRFENFLLFKDSSGADRVALSGKDLGGVFTMRGGESDYARWQKAGGGPYEGFLLGSANCFARELHQLLQDISVGRLEAARRVSERLTAAVSEVSRLVAGLPGGNAFAHANKALDHFFAYGPRAASVPPPRLHGGSRLPVEVIRATGDLLSRNGLMPARGYLDS
jgi:dihydrodipicolinate synthase/N-acetylneuraminate lyase